MTAIAIPSLDADQVRGLLGPREAAAAIRQALLSGLDPSTDPARGVVRVRGGQVLLMPSQTATSVGVKIATVAPGNPDQGLPRIQALYLLFDAETLQPRALLDGTALTSVRTPAVSAAVVTSLAGRFAEPANLVVFGAGPQAVGHVAAFSEISGLELHDVTFIVRRPERVDLEPMPRVPSIDVRATSDSAARKALRRAHLVVCATTSRTPVFDSHDLRDGAVVVAVGSHEPQVRELDGRLMGRASVIVEDLETARREAGDVLLAIAEGELEIDDLIPMGSVVRGDVVIDPGRTAVFKSTGMSWQDIVVAEAIMARHDPSHDILRRHGSG